MKVEYKRAMSKSETRVKPQDSLTETPAGTQLVLPQTRASNVLSPSFAYGGASLPIIIIIIIIVEAFELEKLRGRCLGAREGSWKGGESGELGRRWRWRGRSKERGRSGGGEDTGPYTAAGDDGHGDNSLHPGHYNKNK